MKETRKEAVKYITSIRNQEKKHYAISCLNTIIQGKELDSLDDSKVNLSYMAKQAVRMNLNKIYE